MVISMSPTETRRPPAFIHVDCDGLWAVQSCYGKEMLPSAPGDPFWLEGIPNALSLFGELEIPATLFVIGADLQINAHQQLIRQSVEAGHEIASHSMTHDLNLRHAPEAFVRDELALSTQMIDVITGKPALGFRAPGFSFKPAHLPLIRGMGYLYDSSLFPSLWGPALRTARRMLGSGEGPKQSPYGGWRDGWKSRTPHAIKTDWGPLIEIPVSLTPHLRLPAHASFALLRSTDRAFENIVQWHAKRGIPFVWLIHLIDLCDTENLDLPKPRFAKKALCQSGAIKRTRLRRMLGTIKSHFDVTRTDEWVRSELDRL